MAITTIDYTKLSFDDVFCSKRGSKVARLNSGGDPCILMLKQHLRSPFDASTFDKDPAATRLNLQISLDDPIVVEQLQAFEAWLLDYLAQHSERIFKKVLTSDQLKANYSSFMREPTKDGLSPLLKTKIDIEGRTAVCCWDTNGAAMEPPDTWAGLHIQPRLHFSHLWLMGAQFGLVIRLTDAKIAEESPRPQGVRECPFSKEC